jgi:hypothetical protein
MPNSVIEKKPVFYISARARSAFSSAAPTNHHDFNLCGCSLIVREKVA